MGFACPVCGEVQIDEAHLANHLAFTAILRGGDHEAWLDDHVADWGEMDPEELGPIVADHAPAVDVENPQTDGSTVDEAAGPGGLGRREVPRDRRARRQGAGELTDEERAILERARSLTRKRRENRTAASEKE